MPFELWLKRAADEAPASIPPKAQPAAAGGACREAGAVTNSDPRNPILTIQMHYGLDLLVVTTFCERAVAVPPATAFFVPD